MDLAQMLSSALGGGAAGGAGPPGRARRRPASLTRPAGPGAQGPRKRPGLAAHSAQEGGKPRAQAHGLPARSAQEGGEPGLQAWTRPRLPARDACRHLEVAAADTVTMTQEADWWVAHEHPDDVQRFVDQWRGARDLDCLDLYGASGRVGNTWQAQGRRAAPYDIKVVTVTSCCFLGRIGFKRMAHA